MKQYRVEYKEHIMSPVYCYATVFAEKPIEIAEYFAENFGYVVTEIITIGECSRVIIGI